MIWFSIGIGDPRLLGWWWMKRSNESGTSMALSVPFIFYDLI